MSSKHGPEGKPDSCKTCPLYTSLEGPVWGSGPSDAKIMFVGEAPGEDEGAALRPFIGGSGRVLNAVCNHAQLDRREVYVTNIVKCRPTAKGAGGRIVNRQPTETEILNCGKFLLQELEAVNPNVVVPLGNVPLHTLSNTKKGILTMRSVPLEGPKRRGGAVRENIETFKLVPTIHPAGVMRQQHLWPAVVFDLARARVESASPAISRRVWRRVIHAYLPDVKEALRRRIHTPRLHGHRWYAHDLETTGLDPRQSAVRCIGIAAEADEVLCFDWTPDVQQFVNELHSDPSLLTVGQNSEGFDIPYQEAKGLTFNGPSFDTMIGWHLLNSALPKDLAFIGASVTDEPYWKDDTMYKAGEDALQVGCCKDVHATARAFEDQLQELEQLGQLDLYFKHLMPLQPVLRKMTKRGMRKDIRRAAGWSLVLNRKADELEVRLRKGLGDATFNVDSPKQLMDLLYTRMGLPVQYKEDRTHGLRPTVDADALEDLALIVNNPILLLVRDIRTLRKWDSTFINCPHDDKNYVHGHFSSAKAANGRLSCTDPNMQNFPNEVREIMVPDDEDSIFISRDWNQIEWRIAMALSGDKNGLDALASGRDAHKDAYARAYGRPYESVTKGERFDAKTFNYGLLYGRGVESFVHGKSGGRGGASRSKAATAIPRERAQDYIDRFLSTFSGYDKFRKTIEQRVKTDHYVDSPWGRRRYWYTTQQMPEAYNHPISSSAASMMYEALVELEAQLPTGVTLRLTVHDEVVMHSPKDEKTVRMAIECSRDIMEREFPLIEQHSLYPDVVRHYYPTGWSCPTDYHVGEDWGKCKPDNEALEQVEEELKKKLGISDI